MKNMEIKIKNSMNYTTLEISENRNIEMEFRSDIFSQLRYTKKWSIQIKQLNNMKHSIRTFDNLIPFQGENGDWQREKCIKS